MNNSYRTWYGRKQLELLAPFDEKGVIENKADWAQGVEVSFFWSKDRKAILFGLYPSSGPNSFIYDGRNASIYIRMRNPMERFNQKRFDAELEYWKPLFKILAGAYLLYGHEHYENFRTDLAAVNQQMQSGVPKEAFELISVQVKVQYAELIGTEDFYTEEEPIATTTDNINNQTIQNEMEEPKSLCIALSECEGDSAEMEAVASRIGASIKNGGKSIYNGNDEEIDVPQLFKTADLHPKYVGREQEFGGWLNAEHIKMIDFGKCGAEQRHDLLKQHFDSKTFQAWLDCRKEFDNASTVAVHIDQTDGSWYEYVTNGTTPALEEDAA